MKMVRSLEPVWKMFRAIYISMKNLIMWEIYQLSSAFLIWFTMLMTCLIKRHFEIA